MSIMILDVKNSFAIDYNWNKTHAQIRLGCNHPSAIIPVVWEMVCTIQQRARARLLEYEIIQNAINTLITKNPQVGKLHIQGPLVAYRSGTHVDIWWYRWRKVWYMYITAKRSQYVRKNDTAGFTLKTNLLPYERHDIYTRILGERAQKYWRRRFEHITRWLGLTSWHGKVSDIAGYDPQLRIAVAIVRTLGTKWDVIVSTPLGILRNLTLMFYRDFQKAYIISQQRCRDFARRVGKRYSEELAELLGSKASTWEELKPHVALALLSTVNEDPSLEI
ncbi:MAG: hypothetical protein J7L51_00045 [Desulfurococcales archaeon]|nr:hypothetical protein [Desulfurococcales archaeon]